MVPSSSTATTTTTTTTAEAASSAAGPVLWGVLPPVPMMFVAPAGYTPDLTFVPNRNSPSTHVHYSFPPAGAGERTGGVAAVAVQVCVPVSEAAGSSDGCGAAAPFTYYMAAGFAGQSLFESTVHTDAFGKHSAHRRVLKAQCTQTRFEVRTDVF